MTLPGWIPGLPSGGGGGVAGGGGGDPPPPPPPGVGTLAFVAGVVSTTATITVPAGILAGDLLVLGDRAIAAPAPSVATPVGWLPVANTVISTARQTVSVKLANGAESGGVLTGMTGSTRTKALLVFRRTPAAAGIEISAVGGEGTDGNPAPQLVGSAAGVAPLVVLATYAGSHPVGVRGFVPVKDGELAPSPYFWLAWKIFNSAPANVTVDMDDYGLHNILQSVFIRMI